MPKKAIFCLIKSFFKIELSVVDIYHRLAVLILFISLHTLLEDLKPKIIEKFCKHIFLSDFYWIVQGCPADGYDQGYGAKGDPGLPGMPGPQVMNS